MDAGVPMARLIRNGWEEALHAGHAVIVAPDGSVERTWGRPEDAYLPRSSAKPLQLTGMLGAGLDLAGPQLAICASSHNGEAFHLDTIRAILADGDLSVDDLQNAPGLPYSQKAMLEWVHAGGGLSSLTQNCSGKHSAMLRTARVLGASTSDYLDPEHPVQRAAIAGIERLSGERISYLATDGCGAPVVAISLVGLARAYSRLVQGSPDSPEGRVARAMSTHPEYIGGDDRDVTKFMRAMPGAVAKDGAECVHVVALPGGRAGAVKVSDGSERTRSAVAVGLLRHLGITDEEALAAASPAPVTGGGKPVGHIEAVF